MKLLYSNVLPMERQQETILKCIQEQMGKSDRVEIAVGYTSIASLNELDALVSRYNIEKICLNIGMYYIEGMQKSSYIAAARLNRKWIHSGIGEVRLITPFKYHGKLYCFYKDGTPFAAIIGSANLSILKPEASEHRLYELSALTTDKGEVAEIALHIEELKSKKCSENIAVLKSMKFKFLPEKNTALDGIERVTKVTESEIDVYRASETCLSFPLKLKVPKASEKHMDDNRHYTKSNINVCYAAPRSRRKPRDWYETQLTVGAEIYRMEGYPKKNEPFFVITDDGYKFKAHTTSDNNKQFSAVGDELIMGRWLKGRLVTADIAKYVANTAEDTDRKGMITQEMLEEYGCDTVIFKKTEKKALDEDNNVLDVWLLSFVPSDENSGG